MLLQWWRVMATSALSAWKIQPMWPSGGDSSSHSPSGEKDSGWASSSQGLMTRLVKGLSLTTTDLNVFWLDWTVLSTRQLTQTSSPAWFSTGTSNSMKSHSVGRFSAKMKESSSREYFSPAV